MVRPIRIAIQMLSIVRKHAPYDNDNASNYQNTWNN